MEAAPIIVVVFASHCRYDRILQEGLPDWKQAVYYYRRVRKMGMVELFLLLFAIASVSHYLFGWAVYFEKQLVLVRMALYPC